MQRENSDDPAGKLARVLEARIKLVTWLGEHGREHDMYVPLMEAVDLLDSVLKPEPVR